MSQSCHGHFAGVGQTVFGFRTFLAPFYLLSSVTGLVTFSLFGNISLESFLHFHLNKKFNGLLHVF